jgi:hypothetical protein
MNDLDKDMSLNTSLVIPVGHTRTSMFDIFDLIGYDFVNPEWYADSVGNFVYMYLDTTLALAVDGKVADFSNTANNEYHLQSASYSPPILIVTDVNVGSVSLPPISETFDFDYNGYESGVLVQRVDRVSINHATLNIDARTENIIFSGGAKIQLQIKFPNIQGIGTKTYTIDLNGSTSSIQLPIGSFTVDFPSSELIGSKTGISANIVFVTAGGAIALDNTSDVIVSAKMTNVSFAWAEGFFNRSGSITGDYIFADIPSDLWGKSQIRDNRLLFHNPEITFKFNSNVGVPLNFVVDSIKAVDEGGHSVMAEFNGNVGTQIPLIAPISKGNFAFSSVTFDRQNGTTNRLFTINPEKFIYGFHVEVDHISALAHPNHFLVGPAAISMEAQAKLRFWFDENTEYASQDTLSVNLDSLLDINGYKIEPERVTLNIDFKNKLPLQVIANATFIDENGVVLFVKNNIMIAGPNVDAQGLSIEEKLSQVSISLIEGDTESVMKTKKIVLEYYGSARDMLTQQINVRGTDYLDAFVSLFVKGKIETNLDTLLNKK